MRTGSSKPASADLLPLGRILSSMLAQLLMDMRARSSRASYGVESSTTARLRPAGWPRTAWTGSGWRKVSARNPTCGYGWQGLFACIAADNTRARARRLLVWKNWRDGGKRRRSKHELEPSAREMPQSSSSSARPATTCVRRCTAKIKIESHKNERRKLKLTS